MHTFEVEELELAITYDLIRAIANADEVVVASEARYVDALCPPVVLRANGFIDDAGNETERFTAALAQAFVRLPDLLGPRERLAILGRLFDVGAIDGKVEERELTILKRTAALLSLDAATFSKWLEAHPQIGLIDLDED